MIDNNDKQTGDLLGKKRRGRPSTGKALTGAQRVAKHRAAIKNRSALLGLFEGFASASSADLARWIVSELQSPQEGIETFQACLCELEARRLKL